MENNWEKLEGKQILMIGVHGLPKINIGVIVGCDPDIGICIAHVGETDPWFIVHGPKSPLLKRYPQERIKSQILELESIYRQLKSGYYSRYEDDDNELKIYGRIKNTGSGGNGSVCPFTM